MVILYNNNAHFVKTKRFSVVFSVFSIIYRRSSNGNMTNTPQMCRGSAETIRNQHVQYRTRCVKKIKIFVVFRFPSKTDAFLSELTQMSTPFLTSYTNVKLPKTKNAGSSDSLDRGLRFHSYTQFNGPVYLRIAKYMSR